MPTYDEMERQLAEREARIRELEDAAAAPSAVKADEPAADDSVVTHENNPELYAEMVAHGKVPPPDHDDDDDE